MSTSRPHEKKSQGIIQVIRIHPLGTVNACCARSSNSLSAYFTKSRKYQPAGDAGGKVASRAKNKATLAPKRNNNETEQKSTPSCLV